LELIRQFPLIFSGRHINRPKIVLTRATRCTVDAERPMPLLIDGEVVGTTPLSVEVVPNALRFVR
jgi:diacylglycerol kinase family enzyme